MIIATALISLNASSAVFRAAHFPGSRRIYAANPFTNSTRLRSAIPDGPFAIHGF